MLYKSVFSMDQFEMCQGKFKLGVEASFVTLCCRSEDPDAEDVGHKWTLSALLRYLRAQGTDTAVLMRRIEEVVVKAILASAPPIISACRMFVPYPRNCFGK